MVMVVSNPDYDDILDLTDNKPLPVFEVRKDVNENYYLHNSSTKRPCRSFILFKNQASYFQVDVSFSGDEGRLLPKFKFSRCSIKDGSVQPLAPNAKENKLGLVALDDEASKKFWDLIACLSGCQNVDIASFKRHKILESDKIIEINNQNLKSIIEQLIEKNYSAEVLGEIVRQDFNLAETLAKSTIQKQRENGLEEFKEHLISLDWSESDWDKFFSKNQWIFGLGLNYRFLVAERSQANIGGHDVITGKGDRKTDTLSSTGGDLNFTILIEIKKPDTNIFDGLYRGEKVPLFSEDFYGGINQILSDTKYWELQSSRTEENKDVLEKAGIYTVSPKGILVIGRINEFKGDLHKRNMFQHFRQGYSNVEIITYDELFKRVYFIVYQKPMSDDYFL
ncbi:MAG: Shedu immune nuclease family protein [Candidatus Moraniibacteriota bacterium]